MNKNIIENFLGALILTVAAVFLVYLLKNVDVGSGSEYQLRTSFNAAAGLKEGSDIRISGISVGKVDKIILSEDYKAIVLMNIDKDVLIPIDTKIEISSDGFLGDRYLKLTIGGSEQMAKNNDFLGNSTATETLEQIIGKIIYLINK